MEPARASASSERKAPRCAFPFAVEKPARVLVIEERSGLHLVQLFPRAGRRSEPVSAGRQVEVTDPSGEELVITEPRGLRRVRLFMFPEDVDPLSSSAH